MKQTLLATLALLFSVFNLTAQQPGTLDESFGNNGAVFTDFSSEYNVACKVLVQSDGKILVCGNSGGIGQDHLSHLVRYLTDGSGHRRVDR